MKKKKYKVIAFDLDGVIINSLSNMYISWTRVNKEFNLNLPFNSYKSYIGFPFKVILKKLKIKKNFKNIQSKYSLYSLNNLNKITLYSGIKKVLDKLKKKYLIAIITSKDLVRSREILKINKIRYDFLITPEIVKKGKPFKDSILFLKKKLKLLYNKEILFIGDSYVDFLFAKNSNIDFLFAEWGYGNKMSGSVSVEHPKDILKFL